MAKGTTRHSARTLRVKRLFSRMFSRAPGQVSPAIGESTHTDTSVDTRLVVVQDPQSAAREVEPQTVENEPPQSNNGQAKDRRSKTHFFKNAHDFTMNNPTMYDIKQYFQGGLDGSSLAMMKLAEHMIRGAEFDSSVRDPPPRCHPGTRVRLNEKIMEWCYDQERGKSFLWLHGPAGSGKSAVIQTLAEALFSSDHLAATVFFSRPNNRNDPHRIPATIAFQLSVRIPSYRTYVAEQFALDPNLLDKGVKEQFRIFIIEPFCRRQVGKGEEARAILLDGLDECEGEDQQCNIIRLISAFVLEFPRVPLIWVVASRSEPHIKAVFKDENVKPSYWEEYVPIDSTEACRDVEHYLNASFDTIRNRFPDLVPPPPSRWPDETQFLKLAYAAKGYFAFVSTVVRFVEDQFVADPVSQLDLVLSAIDKLAATAESHPFAALDALYTQILVAIPPTSWRIARRILWYRLYVWTRMDDFYLHVETLLEVSNLLGLQQHVAYSALRKLHSVLIIPPLEKAHTNRITFLHASFSDYLEDSSRSKGFHLNAFEAARDLYWCYFRILQQYQNGRQNLSSIDLSWPPTVIFEENEERPSLASALCGDAKSNWWQLLTTGQFDHSRLEPGPLLSQADSLETLKGVDFAQLFNIYINLDYHRQAEHFFRWISNLWEALSGDVKNNGTVIRTTLAELDPKRIRHEPNLLLVCSVYTTAGRRRTHRKSKLQQVDSRSDFVAFLAQLKLRRRTDPQIKVLIVGREPGREFALFTYESKSSESQYPFQTHYCIPYPTNQHDASILGKITSWHIFK